MVGCRFPKYGKASCHDKLLRLIINKSSVEHAVATHTYCAARMDGGLKHAAAIYAVAAGAYKE